MEQTNTLKFSPLRDKDVFAHFALDGWTVTWLDSIVNQYSGIFNNPFLSWGRYRKGWLRTTLPISFQFHHAQMDGSHAARFLEELQRIMNTI
jgi:chloramphenicol O-acetyltransferase type A